MDDIDDFFDDDFDAALISEIDAIEQRHIAATQAIKSQTPAPEPAPPPVASSSSKWMKMPSTKRSKPSFHSARQVPQTLPSQRDDLYDDPLEISIADDGSYAIVPGTIEPARRFLPATFNVNGSISAASSSRPNPSFAPPPQQFTSSRSTFSGKSKPQQANGHPTFVQSQGDSRPGPSTSMQGVNMEQLQAQLLALQQETEGLRRSLKQVEDEKLMKEGEVNNVRRKMEKEYENHLKAIERLKKENEEAVRKAGKVSTDFQNEIEALRTQLSFKKQEELSRTMFGSVSRSANRVAQSQSFSNQTPLDRGRGSRTTLWTPKKTPGKTSLPSRPTTPIAPLPTQPRPQFSSFHNSFTKESSPVKKRDIKGKGKEAVLTPTAVSVNGSPINPQMELRPQTPDEEIMLVPQLITENNAEDYMDINEPMWRLDKRSELQVVIFNHTYPDHKECSMLEPQFTLQVLLSTTLSPEAPNELKKSLTQSCANIISAFGTQFEGYNWQDLLESVIESFLTCALVLHQAKEFLVLSQLFDLFTCILYAIPDSARVFLLHESHVLSIRRRSPTLVTMLCHIIQTEYVPPPIPVKEPRTRPPDWERPRYDLVHATLDVIEALCWMTDTTDSRRLVPIVATPKCYLNLVDPGQPVWVIDKALRILTTMSFHPVLIRTLMGGNADEGIVVDSARTPVLSSLSALLISPVKWATGPEYWGLVRSIVAFWTSTIDTYDEAVPTLISTQGVVSSLIVRLLWLSNLIWEEVEDIVEASTEEHYLLINTICPALQLLWFLVKPNDPRFNLLRMIQQAASKDQQNFNGLHHLFTVGIGRLSYSEPPSWLPEDAQKTLTDIAGLSILLYHQTQLLLNDLPLCSIRQRYH
ncbi:hypothetical protein FRC03_012696 [Tulasnella sp. 419]|nr:hypothetical protein FRC03_012696 [Tulasnella sp. 419]